MQSPNRPTNWFGGLKQCGVWICSVTLALAIMPLPAQDPSNPPRVAEWIQRLGSEKFGERELAMKKLEALGPTVLPGLRLALKSATDAETQRRLRFLIERLADKELTTKLLTPTRVRLELKDARLDEAVAELARQSGGPIHDGEWFDGTARFVTLSTGETTFWDAYQQLCEKAAFVENETLMGPFPLERGVPDIRQWRNIIAAPPGIHLKPGKQISVPTCVAGSVRFRWLGATPRRDGAVDLRLEVSGEPRLRGLACGGRIVVVKALDSQGQDREVTVANPLTPDELVRAKMLGHRGGSWVVMMLNGTILKGFCFGPAPEVAAGPVIVTLRLAAADKTARRLKELTAKLTLATNVDLATPLVVDKILGAASQSVEGTDGSTIKVERVERMPAKGEIRIDLTWSRPYGADPLGTRSSTGGHMNWKNGIIKINSVDGERSPASLEGAPRLLDGDGKSIALAEWTSHGWIVTRAEMTHRVTLVYRPTAGQANPSQLVFLGQRTFLIDVPFSFKDVAVPY